MADENTYLFSALVILYNIYKLQNGEKNSPEYYVNITWIYF